MRDNIYIGKSTEETVQQAVKRLILIGKKAIADRGIFTLALSGGTTPKSIYKELCKNHRHSLDWSKVWIFFSDERCVPPTNEESNYKMAMENGIGSLNIPDSQIFRMKGEIDPKESAADYQKLIYFYVPDLAFDLVMLGMGEDGHTASLFPKTEALNNETDLVTSNWIPELNTNRLTFTFKLINQANEIDVYVLGKSKAAVVKEIFLEEKKYPIQQLDFCKTHFFLDDASAHLL